MASKLETRIATQRYHGISSRDWFRLTDQEQAALIAEAQVKPLSWSCENGNHGTSERHSEFTYGGSCAGSLRFLDGHIEDCACSCHV